MPRGGSCRTDDLYTDPEFYDALFSDLAEDIGLIRGLAKKTGGPILELMSGTGRVLLPLARDGYEVWGLDNNDAMTRRARAKLSQEHEEVKARVNLVKGDVRSFAMGRKFPLVLVAFGSFLYLQNEKDREACLRNVAEHLESHGRFFVAFSDFSKTPLGFLSRLVATTRVLRSGVLARIRELPTIGMLRLFSDILRIWLLRHPGGRITWIRTVRLGPGEESLRVDFTTADLSTRTVTIDYLYEVIGRRGMSVRRTRRTSFAVISREEMDYLLDRSGLAVVSLTGGFRGEPFRGDSLWQVYICRKKESN